MLPDGFGHLFLRLGTHSYQLPTASRYGLVQLGEACQPKQVKLIVVQTAVRIRSLVVGTEEEGTLYAVCTMNIYNYVSAAGNAG